METKKLFIWGGWQRNVGDLIMLTAESTWFNLQSPTSTGYEIVPLNSHIIDGIIPVFTEQNLQELNDTGTALIIGGGGQLMPRHMSESKSGWQFEIDLDMLDRITKPIILYGLGLNKFPYANDLTAQAKHHFVRVAKKAISVSARDTLTQKWIQSLGIACDLIADPAITAQTGTPYILPTLSPLLRLLGFTWAGDRLEQRIAGESVERYIERLCVALNALCDENDFDKVVFIPHVSIFDTNPRHMELFRKYLGYRYYNLAEHVWWLYPESIVTAGIIKSIYRQMDLVVSMRWHGNILAYGETVPSIPLGNHIKSVMFSVDVHQGYNGRSICVGNNWRNLLEVAEVVLAPDYKEYLHNHLLKNLEMMTNYSKQLVIQMEQIRC